MSDQSQGPGWWLASDGRWYPPETPPATGVAFPPPVGPSWTPEAGLAVTTPGSGDPSGGPPDATPGTTAAIVIGGLLTLVVVGLLVVGLLTRGNDSDAASDITVDAGASSPVDDASMTSTTAATAPPAVAVPADFKTVTDDIAGFSIAIPPSWVAVPIHGDIAGLGDRYAPDDPALAAAIDGGVGALPHQVVFFGADTIAVGSSFVSNFNVGVVPRDSATAAEISAQAGQAVGVFGALDVSVEEIAVPAGAAVRVDFRLAGPGGRSARGEQYYVLVGEQIWIITFTALASAPDDPFDQMMASFRVNG